MQLGGWQLREILGAGGMGEVWRAEHAAACVLGAVKRLRIRAPAELDALRNELLAVAALDHPGIVELLDRGEDPEPYLVVELVDGPSLAAAPPERFEALRADLLQVLDALAHAHARGVLHRDLKPANLLRGRDGRVRLADFGIAHALSRPAHGGGRVQGTLAFIAPEQLAGDPREQCPATDLYALGCMAWLLAAGTPPFPGDAVAGHLGESPPALAPRFPVPPGFEAWLRRLLEKVPAHRFRSAAEAAWALTRLPAAPDGTGAGRDLPEFAPVTLTTPLAARPAGPLVFASRRAPAPVEVPPLPATPDEGLRPPRLLAAGLALAGLRPPRLVGREDEQRALWAAANGFGARVVWLEGAPGVGASRLAAWVGERLAECGGVALTTDAARGPGGWLAASARLDGASAVEARARLARPGLAPADLDALCALVEGGRSDAAGALARWLSAEFDRPLALIWDDADADPVATAWLRALAASGLSALVVVTAHGPMPPELAGATSLVVGPLPARVRRALVRELVDVEDGVAATLDERTAGNPRFLIELVRTWATGGHLAPGPRGLRLVGDEPPPLPEGDAALGRKRVGGLASGDDDERLLVLAALAGPHPDPVVLARAAAEAGLPAPGPLLDRLRAAGVLRGPPSAPTWTHGLVREHLATLRAPERPRLHSALAAALPGGPATDGEVARHLFAAGRAAEAEPLFGAAAAAAGQGVDQGRAEVWCDAWERALDALGAPAEDERRTALLRRRAGVAIDAGRLSAAELLLDEAVAAADQRPSWSLRAELRAQRAVLRERLGRPREALSDCAEAEVLLPTDATGPVRALIELTRAGILANHGQPALARAAADRGLDASPTPFQRAELVCARGRAHLRLGALEESAADFATAAEAYRAAGATRAAASATGEAATVHHVRGDLERAEAGYRAAIEALADAADPSAWNAMVNLAVVLVLQGNDQEASRWTDRVLPRVEAAGYAGPALFARCARWATLEPGPAWDDEADRVEALQARTGVEDGDLAALAERAEHRVSGDRALRAAAFAARRRAGAG